MINEPVAFPEYQHALQMLRACESIICDEALAGYLPTFDLVASHATLKAEYEYELGLLMAGPQEIRYEV